MICCAVNQFSEESVFSYTGLHAVSLVCKDCFKLVRDSSCEHRVIFVMNSLVCCSVEYYGRLSILSGL